MKTFLFTFLVLCSASVSATNVEYLIYQRLTLCKDVAHYKQAHKLPIINLKQEKKVLAAAEEKAIQYQLNAKLIQNFTNQLMESCKQTRV